MSEKLSKFFASVIAASAIVGGSVAFSMWVVFWFVQSSGELWGLAVAMIPPFALLVVIFYRNA